MCCWLPKLACFNYIYSQLLDLRAFLILTGNNGCSRFCHQTCNLKVEHLKNFSHFEIILIKFCIVFKNTSVDYQGVKNPVLLRIVNLPHHVALGINTVHCSIKMYTLGQISVPHQCPFYFRAAPLGLWDLPVWNNFQNWDPGYKLLLHLET